MGRSLRLRDFKRIFRRYGVSVTRASKSTHYKMRRGDVVYGIAVDKHGEVVHVYIQKARRRFGLLSENGVSDREFFDK